MTTKYWSKIFSLAGFVSAALPDVRRIGRTSHTRETAAQRTFPHAPPARAFFRMRFRDFVQFGLP